MDHQSELRSFLHGQTLLFHNPIQVFFLSPIILKVVPTPMPSFMSRSFRIILDKAKTLQNLQRAAWRSALFKVRGLLEGNGSVPVYITLDAYQKLLAEKKKMNDVPVSYCFNGNFRKSTNRFQLHQLKLILYKPLLTAIFRFQLHLKTYTL